MKTIKSVFLIGVFLITGIAYSQSGWYSVVDTTYELHNFAIQFTSENTGYASGSYYGLIPGAFFRTTNAGLNWQITQFTEVSADDICFLDNNTGYVSCWTAGHGSFIIKTTNGGVNWISQDTLPASFFKVKFYDYNTGFIAAKYSGIYKTTNGGNNWFSQTGTNWHEPSCLYFLDADNWFVCDWSNKINKTTNGGINWTVLDFSNIGFKSSSLFFINSNTGFSGSFNGNIFKTTNAGYNWNMISNNIPCYYIYDIKFLNSNTGFICGTDGIFKTTDGGYHWFSSPISVSSYWFALSFININTGYVSGEEGRIYKTTNGGSVFVANISSEVPDKFELGQNYPNPFNQFSILNFKCKIKSMVSLKVFDVTGREVQTLVNEVLAPGTYQVRFDGSGLASGLYYYSMSIDGKQTAVKKMVMVK